MDNIPKHPYPYLNKVHNMYMLVYTMLWLLSDRQRVLMPSLEKIQQMLAIETGSRHKGSLSRISKFAFHYVSYNNILQLNILISFCTLLLLIWFSVSWMDASAFTCKIHLCLLLWVVFRMVFVMIWSNFYFENDSTFWKTLKFVHYITPPKNHVCSPLSYCKPLS
jgi:hypothetical protein